MRSPVNLPARARVVILCACVVLAAYGLAFLEEWQTGRKETGRPTTHSTGSLGYRALFLWLKALGLSVKQWESPFKALSSEVAVLVILQPELGPDPGELGDLERWVREGGTLLVSSMPAGPFMTHFGLEGKRSSGSLHREEQGRRVQGQPGPYLSEEYTVERKSPQGLISSRPEAIDAAGDVRGGVVVVVKEGRGQVIGVADPLLFTNEALREGDHARMILDLLLSHSGNGYLAVDEYHHGYGRATSVFGHVVQSRAFPFLMQGVVILVILWASVGRRFGAPRPVRQVEVRTSMDYVRAMAQLFQRGQKRAFALEASMRWTQEEAGRLLVERDPSLEKALSSARRCLQEEDRALTDGEVLRQAQELYRALEKVRQGG
jgi:hypothetical protein